MLILLIGLSAAASFVVVRPGAPVTLPGGEAVVFSAPAPARWVGAQGDVVTIALTPRDHAAGCLPGAGPLRLELLAEVRNGDIMDVAARDWTARVGPFQVDLRKGAPLVRDGSRWSLVDAAFRLVLAGSLDVSAKQFEDELRAYALSVEPSDLTIPKGATVRTAQGELTATGGAELRANFVPGTPMNAVTIDRGCARVVGALGGAAGPARSLGVMLTPRAETGRLRLLAGDALTTPAGEPAGVALALTAFEPVGSSGGPCGQWRVADTLTALCPAHPRRPHLEALVTPLAREAPEVSAALAMPASHPDVLRLDALLDRVAEASLACPQIADRAAFELALKEAIQAKVAAATDVKVALGGLTAPELVLAGRLRYALAVEDVAVGLIRSCIPPYLLDSQVDGYRRALDQHAEASLIHVADAWQGVADVGDARRLPELSVFARRRAAAVLPAAGLDAD